MKIILSRKGFDSTAGGVPSPIMPDGRMISLPIPDKRSPIRYCDIGWNGGDLGQVVSELTNGRVRPDYRAHLDPDVRRESVVRSAGWRPLFGQCGSAQGHLCNCGVGEGDVFLFFGLFRRVVVRGTRFAWDPSGRPVHVIWGWLQIGEVLVLDRAASVPSWARYHPHCGLREERNNTLYISSRRLALHGVPTTGVPGSGVFTCFSDRLQLSDPEAARHVQWRLPLWMFPGDGKPPLTFHSDAKRWSRCEDAAQLRSVNRGQEYVLDGEHYPEAPGWVSKLIRSQFSG